MRATDLEHTPFYTTSFEIAATSGDDALWGLVQCVRGWVCGKWRSVPRDIEHWRNFKLGKRAELDAGDDVALESALITRENGSVSWAGAVRETFSEPGCAPREWRTEIGFSSSEGLGRGTVSIATSYADWSGFLGPIQSTPGASVPGIVRRILGCDWLAATTSGVSASLDAIGLRAGDFEGFWQLVSDPARTVPVVYVSPRFEADVVRHAVDPRRLAAALGTSARVYYSIDQGFCSEMDAGLPDLAFRCDGGTLRVYAAHPRLDWPNNALKHRYFTFSRASELGDDQLLTILRRALAAQPAAKAPMDVAAIRAELRNLRVTREAKLISTMAKADADRRVEEILDEAIRLEEENAQLVAQLSTTWTAGASGDVAARETIELGPCSPEEIGRLMVQVYPERIDFTERGWKSLRKDCKASADVVWNGLRDLACIAHELYLSGEHDVEGAFNARSTFRFAPSAGMMTRKGAKYMAQYQDVYQGRSLNCEVHLAKGKDFRIYFAFDRASGKIVVSSCGPHFDNASTRGLH